MANENEPYAGALQDNRMGRRTVVFEYDIGDKVGLRGTDGRLLPARKWQELLHPLPIQGIVIGLNVDANDITYHVQWMTPHGTLSRANLFPRDIEPWVEPEAKGDDGGKD